ncbi:hypothetical protein ACFL15_02010 [Patescibacteria group bacterium]
MKENTITSIGYLIQQLEENMKPLGKPSLNDEFCRKKISELVTEKVLTEKQATELKRIYNDYGYDSGFDF